MKVKVAQSCPTLRSHRLYSPWNSLGQNTGVGSLSLLQGIFPTQGSNPGLLHCRWILYQLSHQGSPRILEWVSLSNLQGIFLTQESNRGLLHRRQTLYYLSYHGQPAPEFLPGKSHGQRSPVGYSPLRQGARAHTGCK